MLHKIFNFVFLFASIKHRQHSISLILYASGSQPFLVQAQLFIQVSSSLTSQVDQLDMLKRQHCLYLIEVQTLAGISNSTL